MASINTNYGASIALQNLNKTNSELERTQNRINTGMKVSSAKDSGAIYSIATSQRAAAASQDAVRAGLQRTQSITDVALAAGDTITAALEEMKGLAVSIAGSTGAAQTSYLAEYNALGTEIASAITGASFDGVNSLTALGSNAAITAVNTGSITAANATTANVDAAIAATTSTLSTLGTQSKSLGRQISFVNKLQDALEAGVGNLVDADLAKESAKLTALQTKQQLGVQALSIANSSSQTLLGLFR
ncbi:MAG: flagellin [Brevundimonas aurantiaca]|jgi:flagellin|uniref:Flagellin n=1 Tax=Brevundimonas aurantiaca TaxID=74316 RepID=A0A7W9FBD6_9CAUL|nr:MULTISPECIES: flagellin [Brevundimonas]MBB1179511.1 flagellin [Pseudomonas sp. FW305-3-2-15-E-TSA4]MED5536361.1 flagellin [Pseudomonadota bacterium]ALJ08190.1 flagellin [Brevundimonas sp. DS20]MBB5741328.1 flagellin [Brevundimonas aurantiaca]MCC4295581.1 flagellin [Brevundimonas aurantiaca]